MERELGSMGVREGGSEQCTWQGIGVSASLRQVCKHIRHGWPHWLHPSFPLPCLTRQPMLSLLSAPWIVLRICSYMAELFLSKPGEPLPSLPILECFSFFKTQRKCHLFHEAIPDFSLAPLPSSIHIVCILIMHYLYFCYNLYFIFSQIHRCFPSFSHKL